MLNRAVECVYIFVLAPLYVVCRHLSVSLFYLRSMEIIRKQLTQAGVIVVALTSADAISVFANSLHSGILASTIV